MHEKHRASMLMTSLLSHPKLEHKVLGKMSMLLRTTCTTFSETPPP
jgi:hypothetical protein